MTSYPKMKHKIKDQDKNSVARRKSLLFGVALKPQIKSNLKYMTRLKVIYVFSLIR